MKVYLNTVFKELYSSQATEVSLPGDEGELSVMDFHQPMICRLIEGNVRIISPHKKEENIRIKNGVAHMEANTLRIMAEV